MMEKLSSAGKQYWLATTKVINNKIQSAANKEDIIEYLNDGYAVILQQGCSQYAHCESVVVE